MSWQKKALVTSSLVISLVLYLLGLRFPFVLVELICLAVSLPMPTLFRSWTSRLLLALLFLLAFLQVSAVLQFLIYPAGKFKFIAGLCAVLSVLVIWLFGKSPDTKKVPIWSHFDTWALGACVVFIVPFAPILAGKQSAHRIASLASVQVIDSIAHFSDIMGDTRIQTLHYTTADYYPRGFHISSAFIQQSFISNSDDLSWTAKASLFFGEYLFWGVLLMYFIIFLFWTVMDWLGGATDQLSGLIGVGSLAVAITVLYLLLFMSQGFLNYYYICATVIAAALYVLDRDRLSGFEKLVASSLVSKWPLLAYILLTLGVAYSWPLLVPPVLLTGLLWVLPTPLGRLAKAWRQILSWPNAVLVVGLAGYGIGLYLQTHFMQSSAHAFFLDGVIRNFNIVLLLTAGLVVFLALHSPLFTKPAKQRLISVIVPYMILIIAFMLIQYFVLGEARYYLIKSSMLLEMFLLTTAIATVVVWSQKAALDAVSRLVLVPAMILLVVFGSIGLTPHPLMEIRNLFRDYAHASKPDFLDHDIAAASRLGEAGKLQQANLTILHYDSTSARLSGYINTAVWANLMAPPPSSSMSACFQQQFQILAYAPPTPDNQTKVIQAVRDCVQAAQQLGIPYYIVTDPASLPKLQETFPGKVQFVE